MILGCRSSDRPEDPAPAPPEYASAEAPRQIDLDKTRRTFVDNCAPCHGEQGVGDGPASVGLAPKPASFSAHGFLSSRSDGYLLWRISEGKPGTAMSSFKDSLALEERLALITFLRREWER